MKFLDHVILSSHLAVFFEKLLYLKTPVRFHHLNDLVIPIDKPLHFLSLRRSRKTSPFHDVRRDELLRLNDVDAVANALVLGEDFRAGATVGDGNDERLQAVVEIVPALSH